MDLLPYDLLHLVCEYLPLKDVVALSRTCKGLHSATSTQHIWRTLLTRDYRLVHRFGPAPAYESGSGMIRKLNLSSPSPSHDSKQDFRAIYENYHRTSCSWKKMHKVSSYSEELALRHFPAYDEGVVGFSSFKRRLALLDPITLAEVLSMPLLGIPFYLVAVSKAADRFVLTDERKTLARLYRLSTCEPLFEIDLALRCGTFFLFLGDFLVVCGKKPSLRESRICWHDLQTGRAIRHSDFIGDMMNINASQYYGGSELLLGTELGVMGWEIGPNQDAVVGGMEGSGANPSEIETVVHDKPKFLIWTDLKENKTLRVFGLEFDALKILAGLDGGGESQIRVWDRKRWCPLYTFSHRGISAFVFKEAQLFIAADEVVLVLDLATGAQISRLYFQGFPPLSDLLAFDSRTLLVSSPDEFVRVQAVGGMEEMEGMEE